MKKCINNNDNNLNRNNCIYITNEYIMLSIYDLINNYFYFHILIIVFIRFFRRGVYYYKL